MAQRCSGCSDIAGYVTTVPKEPCLLWHPHMEDSISLSPGEEHEAESRV